MSRIGPGAGLDERRDGLDAGRPRQLADLGELLAGIGSLRQDGDDEPSLRIRPGGGIGLAMGHGTKYPTPTPHKTRAALGERPSSFLGVFFG